MLNVKKEGIFLVFGMIQSGIEFCSSGERLNHYVNGPVLDSHYI